MPTSPCLEAARVKIVPFSETYLTENYLGWLNDQEIMFYSEQRYHKHTIESSLNYLNSFKGTENGFWAILERNKENHIGTLTTYVNQYHGVADIGILIGERSLWGKGYGAEAWRLMCDYLFDVVKIRKITAGTLSVNYSMLKVMEKTGMIDDGVRVGERVTPNGEVVDLMYKALFRKH